MRCQLAVKLKGSQAKQFFPLPEAVERSAAQMTDPSKMFLEIRMLQHLGPGDALVHLQVDAKKLWYKVLAANLDTELLEPHHGKLLVRRAFPDDECCTQVLTSSASIYLGNAAIAAPFGEEKVLVTFLSVVPVGFLGFRLRHLARASLNSRALLPWISWLFSENMVQSRAWSEAFYVVLSIENCCNGPPLLPHPTKGADAKPFNLGDWQVSADDTFAAYLRHFLAAAGLGDFDIFSSLDGKQLAVHQAALSRETWISLAPSFWPLFHNASIAYRRMASFKLQLAEDIPELVEDASHVAEQLNNLTF